MSRALLKDQTDLGPGKGSENKEFLLNLIKTTEAVRSRKLEQDMFSKDEVIQMLGVMQHKIDQDLLTKSEFLQTLDAMQPKLEQVEENKREIMFLSRKIDSSKACKTETTMSINIMTSKIDALRDVVESLLTKKDTDSVAQNAAVTNSQLDTDYADLAGDLL